MGLKKIFVNLVQENTTSYNMATRKEKEDDIQYITDKFYRKWLPDLTEDIVADYVQIRDKYWKEEIVSGKVTLDKFRKIWKNEKFSKDWRDDWINNFDQFEDIRLKYGKACVKRIMDEIIEVMCEEAYSTDEE